MIRKFGCRNFSCFRSSAEIDFTLNKNVPESVSNGKDFATVLGIKGGNGSGKTNLLKAFTFMMEFCSRSADKDNEEPIFVDPFFRNNDPIDFYIDFHTGGNDYFYELSLDSQKIISEKLSKKAKKTITIFDRQQDVFKYTTRDLSELDKIKLKSNSSIISLYKKYSFKSQMEDLERGCLFFNRCISNVGYYGFKRIGEDIDYLSKAYKEDPNALKFAINVIKQADSGIADVHIHSREDEEGTEIYFPLFDHKFEDKNNHITLIDESSGTQSLFKLLYAYWLILETGGVLILDEFDLHLHALILPKLIDLFLDKEVNKKDAQFLFTAHNTEIIDKLGKYRTVLVNKEDNESYCYRLDEIPGSLIRNDRLISPLYLDGRIGGVPKNGTL